MHNIYKAENPRLYTLRFYPGTGIVQMDFHSYTFCIFYLFDNVVRLVVSQTCQADMLKISNAGEIANFDGIIV